MKIMINLTFQIFKLSMHERFALLFLLYLSNDLEATERLVTERDPWITY